MLDTGNIEDISRYVYLFPVSGITANLSILKHGGKMDFFPYLKACSKCGFLRPVDRKNLDFRALRTFGSMEPAR
jgi:hypothetical protein